MTNLIPKSVQARENEKKYIVPPSIDQIDKVVKKLKISESQFERTFGLYPGSISHVRQGFRRLPAQHWHLFYEKIEISITPRRSFSKSAPQKEANSNSNSTKENFKEDRPKPTDDNLLGKLLE